MTCSLISLRQFARKVLVVAVLMAAAAAMAAASTRGIPDRAAAREIFRLLNEFRAEHDQAALAWDDRLADAALDHDFLVAANKQLSHQYSGEPILTLRLAKNDIRLNRAGENLASASTVTGAHEALVASPPHRANMLSPDFNAVGIAVVRAGDTFYVVQDFAHRLAEIPTAQFEDEIAAEFDRLRARSRTAPLTHASSDMLRNAACAMARKDDLDANDVRVPGARHIVSFTINEAQKLPKDLTQLRTSTDLGSYTVGACFARNQSYPNGTFWVLMALFPKNSHAARPR